MRADRACGEPRSGAMSRSAKRAAERAGSLRRGLFECKGGCECFHKAEPTALFAAAVARDTAPRVTSIDAAAVVPSLIANDRQKAHMVRLLRLRDDRRIGPGRGDRAGLLG